MRKSLLLDTKFWPIFWTQFLGAFNDNVLKNALVILITFKSYQLLGLGAKDMVALCGGIFILPFFLFSPIAGQIADKFSKTKLIFWIKVWEFLAMILATIGFIGEHILLLLFTLFLMGLQSTFFGPIKYSILPELLDELDIMRGNALVSMGTFVSILIGTILGGGLISLDQNGGALVSITLIIFALIGIITGKKVKKLEPTDPELKFDFRLFAPIRSLLKLSSKNQVVHQSIRGISWFWFLGAAILSLIPPYCKELLQADETVVTFFLAVFSVGVGIGSIVCEKICKGQVKLGTVPLGCIGMSFFLMDLFIIGVPDLEFQTIKSLVTHLTGLRILSDLLFFSICGGFFIVPLYTLMQVITDVTIRSRIVASNNILNALYMVIASVFLIILFQMQFPIPTILLILAGLNLLFNAFLFYKRREFIQDFKQLIGLN